jgi:hypothetical protein
LPHRIAEFRPDVNRITFERCDLRSHAIAFGLLVQGYSVWKLRGAVDWHKLWPFIAGAALGVPQPGPTDLPAMANQIFAFGCGKSTRRANHFGLSETVSSPFCKNISVFT